jgi:hypothetical protein
MTTCEVEIDLPNPDDMRGFIADPWSFLKGVPDNASHIVFDLDGGREVSESDTVSCKQSLTESLTKLVEYYMPHMTSATIRISVPAALAAE